MLIIIIVDTAGIERVYPYTFTKELKVDKSDDEKIGALIYNFGQLIESIVYIHYAKRNECLVPEFVPVLNGGVLWIGCLKQKSAFFGFYFFISYKSL